MSPILKTHTRPVWNYDDEHPIGSETYYTIHDGDDRYEFEVYSLARRALVEITAARLEDRDVFPCGWVVEDAYPEGDRFTRPCGLPAIVDADGEGFACVAGHWHRSGIEWFDDDEVAGMAADGIPLPANAHRMNGTPLA